MKILRKAEEGLAQLVVLGLMTLMAVALPITTKLVQNSQENRSKAAETGSIPATGITLDTTNPINLFVGQSFKINYHLLPNNSDDKVTWTIQKGSDVISLTSDGVIKGLSTGKALILALTS